MWPSIVFQPSHLVKSLVGAKVWEKLEPLNASARVDYKAAADRMQIPKAKLAEAYEIELRPSIFNDAASKAEK